MVLVRNKCHRLYGFIFGIECDPPVSVIVQKHDAIVWRDLMGLLAVSETIRVVSRGRKCLINAFLWCLLIAPRTTSTRHSDPFSKHLLFGLLSLECIAYFFYLYIKFLQIVFLFFKIKTTNNLRVKIFFSKCNLTKSYSKKKNPFISLIY